MPRLQRGRSRLGDILIYDRGPDGDPIALQLDTDKKPFEISQRWLPQEPGEAGLISVQEWTWSNGPSGAGTTVESSESYASGACEVGDFVWLRRLGVAQPAGKLRKLLIPSLTASFHTGQRFVKGQVFGDNNDLYISTSGRTVVKVGSGLSSAVPTESDFGASSVTSGLAVFSGSGTAYLYAGDDNGGIRETADGITWTTGAAGTERHWLETPYWTLGDQLSTGGAVSDSGIGNFRLVGTRADVTGFYHVAGDPKVAANWSSLIKVGTGGLHFPIVSTVASNRVVWFGTGLGILGIDEVGHQPNQTKWVELIAARQNCTATAYWSGLIWFATEQGLSAFRPTGERVDIPRFMQFGARSAVTAIYGRPRALAPSEHGLYVGYYNEFTHVSYIGILLMDDDGRVRWSMAEAVIRQQEVTWLQQTADVNGDPHLFIGTLDLNGFLHLYAQDLPRSGDPEADYQSGESSFNAATNWSVTLSRFNGARPIPKTFRRFMLEADYLGDDFPGNTVDFHVSPDGGAHVLVGTATQSPRWHGAPATAYVSAVSAQFLLAVTNAPDRPVVIRSAGARYSPHPELTKVVSIPIIIAEGLGMPDPKSVLQRLEIAQRAGPLTIVDFLGRTIEGIVEPGINETLTIETTINGMVAHATVTISYSRVAARFDVGDLFDTGQLFT